MAKIRGWLYVSQKSAKFVADEQTFLTENIDWQKLADPEKLKQFLIAFEPLETKGHSSTHSYYLEFAVSEVKAWLRD